jgi:TetR/AcrR family transcriptional regulator, transcriptional repressor for nem operon
LYIESDRYQTDVRGYVKVSRDKAEEHRRRLIEEAGRLFRERGEASVGVAEIAKAAGLSQGALYSQFESKADLAAEAFRHGQSLSAARVARAVSDGATPQAIVDFYVSGRQRDNFACCCPMLASASDGARQDAAGASAFHEAFLQLAESLEAALDRGGASDSHERSLALVAAMIGGVALARALHASDPGLSDDLLAAVRRWNPGG